jgi:hypothetical protein
MLVWVERYRGAQQNSAPASISMKRIGVVLFAVGTCDYVVAYYSGYSSPYCASSTNLVCATFAFFNPLITVLFQMVGHPGKFMRMSPW